MTLIFTEGHTLVRNPQIVQSFWCYSGVTLPSLLQWLCMGDSRSPMSMVSMDHSSIFSYFFLTFVGLHIPNDIYFLPCLCCQCLSILLHCHFSLVPLWGGKHDMRDVQLSLWANVWIDERASDSSTDRYVSVNRPLSLERKTRRANAQLIHSHQTCRICLQTTTSHMEPFQTFGLLHVTWIRSRLSGQGYLHWYQTAAFSHVQHYTKFKMDQLKGIWKQASVKAVLYRITLIEFSHLKINYTN